MCISSKGFHFRKVILPMILTITYVTSKFHGFRQNFCTTLFHSKSFSEYFVMRFFISIYYPLRAFFKKKSYLYLLIKGRLSIIQKTLQNIRIMKKAKNLGRKPLLLSKTVKPPHFSFTFRFK